MNHFEFRIYKEVYDDMVSGKKTIEFRLLNNKTESIKEGDEIQFKVLDNNDKYILVEVVSKYIYNDLEELWNQKEILNNILNYSKDEFVSAFYSIFGKEKVDNSKIVGIKFKIKKFA
ncbi:MAG: ASCH domain-containing protein [Clostridia bacterium]|nr:ASCH domain-containing protein [Clostridia bacterium]